MWLTKGIDKRFFQKTVFDDLFQRLLRRREEEPPPAAPPPPKPAEQRRAIRWPEVGTAWIEWIDAEDEFRRELATVHDRSMRGIGVLLEQRLTVGWPALIQHRDETLRGMVRHCDLRGRRWLTGFSVVGDERRRFDRTPFESPAYVSWQDGAEGRSAAVMIVDGGEGGVQLSCAEAIPVERTICIHTNGWRRFGTVAHCQFSQEEHRIGVQFVGEPIADDSKDYED